MRTNEMPKMEIMELKTDVLLWPATPLELHKIKRNWMRKFAQMTLTVTQIK